MGFVHNVSSVPQVLCEWVEPQIIHPRQSKYPGLTARIIGCEPIATYDSGVRRITRSPRFSRNAVLGYGQV